MEEEKVVLAKVAWSHILSNILGSFFVNRWRGSGKSTHPPMPRQHLIGRNWRQSGGMSGCHELIGHIILSICRSLLHWIDFKPFLLNSLHLDWLNDWCLVLGNKHEQLSTPVYGCVASSMYTDTECLRAPDIGSEDCFWKMIFGHLVGVLKCPLWLTILPLNVLQRNNPPLQCLQCVYSGSAGGNAAIMLLFAAWNSNETRSALTMGRAFHKFKYDTKRQSNIR